MKYKTEEEIPKGQENSFRKKIDEIKFYIIIPEKIGYYDINKSD